MIISTRLEMSSDENHQFCNINPALIYGNSENLGGKGWVKLKEKRDPAAMKVPLAVSLLSIF
jgi:hypothetical protein